MPATLSAGPCRLQHVSDIAVVTTATVVSSTRGKIVVRTPPLPPPRVHFPLCCWLPPQAGPTVLGLPPRGTSPFFPDRWPESSSEALAGLRGLTIETKGRKLLAWPGGCINAPNQNPGAVSELNGHGGWAGNEQQSPTRVPSHQSSADPCEAAHTLPLDRPHRAVLGQGPEEQHPPPAPPPLTESLWSQAPCSPAPRPHLHQGPSVAPRMTAIPIWPSASTSRLQHPSHPWVRTR